MVRLADKVVKMATVKCRMRLWLMLTSWYTSFAKRTIMMAT